MPPVRTDLTKTNRMAHNATSRTTIRKLNTDHLSPEAAHLDGYHSQTDTDVEVAQGWGSVAVPLDQEQQSQQGQQGKQSGGGGEASEGLSNDQPKGKAAELMMHRVGGSQSNPTAFPVADRRVQPYGMKAGESSFYAMSGTGQMLFHDENGSYLLATDNGAEQGGKESERMASLRHVNKKKQSREIKKGQKQEDAKHAGESVNTEVKCTKDRISFMLDGEEVAYFDRGAKNFVVKVETKFGEDAKHPVQGDAGGIGRTTKKSGAGAVLINAKLPAAPAELDTQP